MKKCEEVDKISIITEYKGIVFISFVQEQYLGVDIELGYIPWKIR